MLVTLPGEHTTMTSNGFPLKMSWLHAVALSLIFCGPLASCRHGVGSGLHSSAALCREITRFSASWLPEVTMIWPPVPFVTTESANAPDGVASAIATTTLSTHIAIRRLTCPVSPPGHPEGK